MKTIILLNYTLEDEVFVTTKFNIAVTKKIFYLVASTLIL